VAVQACAEDAGPASPGQSALYDTAADASAGDSAMVDAVLGDGTPGDSGSGDSALGDSALNDALADDSDPPDAASADMSPPDAVQQDQSGPDADADADLDSLADVDPQDAGAGDASPLDATDSAGDAIADTSADITADTNSDTSPDTATDAAPTGPTDYELLDLKGVPPKVNYNESFGNKTLTVTVANLGKAGANATMAPQLWLSAEPKTAAPGAVELTGFLVTSVGNFAAPTTKTLTLTTTAQQGFTYLNAINLSKFKYMCVRLVYPAGMNGPDGNLANNETCAPAEFRSSDDAVVDLVDPQSKATLAASTLEVGVAKKIAVSLQNLDDFAGGAASWSVWLSADNQASANDVKLAAGITQLGAGAAVLAEATITAPANTTSLKYLCASLDSYKVYPLWNPNAANDALCVPIAVKATPDLVVSATDAPTLATGSGVSPGLGYGTPWNCNGLIENLGTAGSAPFDIRCGVRLPGASTWLLQYTKNLATFAPGAKHALALQNPAVTAALLPDAPLGVASLELCITADPDGKVPEKSETNNEKCATIGLYGANYATTKATFNNQGAGGTLKLGSTVAVNWSIKNSGNYKNTTSFKGRIYLSKDNALSADDTLWGTTPAYVGGVNSGLEVVLLHPAIFSLQMPASFPLGDAYLLFLVDADAEAAEANEKDNQLALPVKVVP
jgi:hypothetical protein